MAIELEILESGGFGQAGDDNLPVLRKVITRQRIVAAGASANFQAATKVIHLRNHGDAVHVRINAEGTATQAASTDDQSIKLRSLDDEITFDLPAGTYFLDVRAA